MTPFFTSNDPAGLCDQPSSVVPSKIDLQRGQPGKVPAGVGSGAPAVSLAPASLAVVPPLPPVTGPPPLPPVAGLPPLPAADPPLPPVAPPVPPVPEPLPPLPPMDPPLPAMDPPLPLV